MTTSSSLFALAILGLTNILKILALLFTFMNLYSHIISLDFPDIDATISFLVCLWCPKYLNFLTCFFYLILRHQLALINLFWEFFKLYSCWYSTRCHNKLSKRNNMMVIALLSWKVWFCIIHLFNIFLVWLEVRSISSLKKKTSLSY